MMTNVPKSMLEKEVDAFRREAEHLILKQSGMGWDNWINGTPIHLAETYKGHERLFSLETIEKVNRLCTCDHDPAKTKYLSYFKKYLLGEYIASRTASLQDAITNKEVRSMTKAPGGEIPFRRLRERIAGEKNYRTRRRIADAALSVVERLNPLLMEKEETSRRLCRELGYDSYNTLSEELRNMELETIQRMCETVLEASESLYKKYLPLMTERFAGIPLKKFRRCDIGRLFKNQVYNDYFPILKLYKIYKSSKNKKRMRI